MAINPKQTVAKKVWDQMEQSGENLDHEWVISQAISLTSPNTDPRLYPANAKLAYQDLGDRFTLARKIIFDHAFPKTSDGGGADKKPRRSVVITLEGDESLKSEKWEEADEKTKEFRNKVAKAGYVNIKKGDLEYLNNRGLLPEKLQGTEITAALHLYSRGATSEDIAEKAEALIGVEMGERDYLLRTAYFMACFEEANLKEGLPSTELVQLANLNPEASINAYDSIAKPNPNQFVLVSDGQTLTPIISFDKEGGEETSGIRDELGDMVFKAVEKGAKKVIRKGEKEVAEKVAEGALVAGEEAVGIAAKAGVKTAIKGAVVAGAEAAGTAVPIIGNIIAWLAVEIGDKILSFAVNQLGKIKKTIEDHPEYFVAFGLGALIGGLAFGILPLTLLGIGALLLAGSAVAPAIGGIAAGAVAAVVYTVTSVVAALGTAMLYFVVFTIIVILFFYMITVGGYVVPYWSDTAYDPLNVGQENPYIGVGKIADPTENPTPTRVTYTITIVAKQGNLTNVQVSNYTCQVFKKNKQNVNCPSTTPSVPSGITVEVNNPYQFTYTVDYGAIYSDALIVDTITITADSPTKSGVSASSTASVCFGDCPSDCIKVIPGGWPGSTESNLLTGVASLTGPFTQKVCASSFGDVNLCYNPTRVPDGGNCDQVIYARHYHGNDCDIVFNRCGLGSVGNATFILAHELTHHIQRINGSYLSMYQDSGAFSEAPYCTYSATNDPYEAHAEATALYVGPPTWNVCISPSYQAQYPKSYQFARDVMFK